MTTSKSNPRIGVVLLNLGGPERLADVRPFLYNLFSDREIIRLGPPFLQKPIAWFIAWRRAPKSMESYRLIGGGSPLNRITSAQAAALEERLRARGLPAVVGMAMRYWRPYAGEIIERFAALGIRRLVLLTLYPHYSVATTGSSMTDFRRQAAGRDFDITATEAWPDQPGYVRELAATITECRQALGDDARVVYSAHSLPVRFIEEGDPYCDHLRRTIEAVEALTGVRGELCYQSRSGPVRWLSPSTPETLERLAAEGCRRLVMVPISFVSDHVETLYEIDILYRQQAQDLGMELRRSASLNTRPGFIEALADLVEEAAGR